MDIVTGISAATEALKLTKELRDIDREVDKAELKLRLVELTDRLLEAKEALLDAKQERRDLLGQIDQLKAQASKKARLVDENGRLYEVDDKGDPIDEPYCNLCFVREDKLYRLMPRNDDSGRAHVCNNCHTYLAGPSRLHRARNWRTLCEDLG